MAKQVAVHLFGRGVASGSKSFIEASIARKLTFQMAILEWSQGDIATVSLHTYERCPQVVRFISRPFPSSLAGERRLDGVHAYPSG